MDNRIERLESKVATLETRMAVAESNIKDIREDINKIKDNTTWILRLIIGAMITAVLGILISGGQLP